MSVIAEQAAQNYADNPDAVGAWMTPKQLRQRNKELAKAGRRICRAHQGAALPLTDEYFYYIRPFGRFETICKSCKAQAAARRKRERYASDPQYREQVLANSRASQKRRRDFRRAYEKRRRMSAAVQHLSVNSDRKRVQS